MTGVTPQRPREAKQNSPPPSPTRGAPPRGRNQQNTTTWLVPESAVTCVPAGPRGAGEAPGQSWVWAEFCPWRWGTKPYCRKPGVLFQGSTFPNGSRGAESQASPWAEQLPAHSGSVGGGRPEGLLGYAPGRRPLSACWGSFKDREDGSRVRPGRSVIGHRTPPPPLSVCASSVPTWPAGGTPGTGGA